MYINLLWEIGWSKSLPDLHRDAKMWLAADGYVFYVICVKLFKTVVVGGVRRRPCVVCFFVTCYSLILPQLLFYDGTVTLNRPVFIVCLFN